MVLNSDEITTAEELIVLCKNEIGEVKTPSEIVFVNSLPKGASGKILKRELRAREATSKVTEGEVSNQRN